MKKCVYCGVQMSDDSLFCTECGKPVTNGKVCSYCGAALQEGEKFCTNCGKRVDQDTGTAPIDQAMENCPYCGNNISHDDIFCQHCGKKIDSHAHIVNSTRKDVEQSSNQISNRAVQQTTILTGELPTAKQERPSSNMRQESYSFQDNKKNSNRPILIAIIAAALLLICGVGGYFYYKKVYLPAKIDREAPRYYTIANAVVLRSSRSAGADFNKLASLPYGTELITYEHDKDWSRVKFKSHDGEEQEGYVSSSYILSKADFFLMNSIFGNQDSKEAISTTKCRMALLNYFKEKNYIGKIDDELRTEAGIAVTPNDNNTWQVFTKPKDLKPNSVFYKHLYNKSSKYTDFAVIISNENTGDRMLLYFYFDDDETPHLLKELSAPSSGYIKDIKMISGFNSYDMYIDVEYSY